MKFHSYIPSNIKVCAEFLFTPHIYCFIYGYRTFSAVTQLEQTRNLLKLWIRIQQYTATDFQGWSKITLKIKMAHFSTLEVGSEKLTLTAI